MPTTYQFPEPTSETDAVNMFTGDLLNLVINSAVQLCCDHPEYFHPPFPSGHSVESGRAYEAVVAGTAKVWVSNPGTPCGITPPPTLGRSVHITTRQHFPK